MLFSPVMRNAVLQATAICTVSLLYFHYAEENIFDEVTQDETFKTLLNLLTNGTMPNATIPGLTDQTGQLAIDAKHTVNTSDGASLSFALQHGNETRNGLNGTNGINGTADSEIPESFYRRTLPREVIISLALAILQYWWLIGLERILPARPRYRDAPVQQKEQVEENEDREEEVVKKWIAQGRVHRASLNWRNTFVKWVLDMTVGMLSIFTVEHMLRQLLKMKSPMLIFKDLGEHLIFNFLGTFFSVTPLVRLLAFILVPAYKQIIFIEGIQLVWTVFALQFLRITASWAVKTEFAQGFMQNMTKEHEANMKYQQYRTIRDREL
ncbi:hypothetical protein J4E93_002555 [Alternaria ventricosa]|uniref:uncharacterized protein n=1 Tax=Alternaria ventricosa TaxID=1187951 RepID=UPI0020C3C191|nr:uncharacterized protein J4E93_002555 [Alternaria ventricosa]KAI4652354.1 hypothetical protein J4E93_002555 [Alternaria ventricosa]